MKPETKLHAVAWLRWNDGKWVAEMTYLHALDSANARALFIGGREPGERFQISAVGPVIGYWANETKDKKIIVTV